MAKPGPKGKSNVVKLAQGTARPDRKARNVVQPLPGAPVKPSWLKGRASTLWDEKTAIYAARGQAVRGVEHALAQYCRTEAELIDGYVRKVPPPVALISAVRLWANEFLDTPAAQLARGGGAIKPNSNPFENNGRPPA